MVYVLKYHIARNFDGGNFFDTFQLDPQNLSFRATQCLVKDSDHPSKYFPSKTNEKSVSAKSSLSQNFLLYSIHFVVTTTNTIHTLMFTLLMLTSWGNM